MSDDDEQKPANKAKSLPALLATLYPIRNADVERIVKNLTCRFEADAVLALIDAVLGLVPLEPHSCIPELRYCSYKIVAIQDQIR